MRSKLLATVVIVGLAFVARSLVPSRFVGFFKSLRTTRWAAYDTRLYSPLFLLLDVWPLGRWPRSGAREAPPSEPARPRRARLLAEKLPLAALAGMATVMAFLAQRRWNLALFRGLGKADLDREGIHPERGPETLGGIIRLLAGHDLNHLGQLERL